MIDRPRIAALLERVRAEVAALHDIAGRSDDELQSDLHLLAAAKYRLIVAVEAAIDAGDHVIASEGLRASRSLADTFVSLMEAGWISAEISSSLQDAARFRNLLVHQYDEIDDGRVIEIVRTRTGDLTAYCRVLAERVEGSVG
jgi:uncharacterized protein YutE (UPF0331/DUF86 family)